MSAVAGVLLILLANGSAILHPLPTQPGAVCLMQQGDTTARCWRPVQRIAGTPGEIAQPYIITVRDDGR